MTPAKTGHTTRSIDRFESISMSELDREIAKTQIQRAELFAELLVAAGSAIGAALLRVKPVAAKPRPVSRPRAPV